MRINAARTVNELISAVSMAMDIEDGVKLFHGWRVAIAAADLTRALNPTNVTTNFYAGILHDVGAVGLPLHLVRYLAPRPGAGEIEERTADPAVVAHPLLSAEIVSSLPGIASAARAVLDHHEDWNGHGFPRGLHEKEISPDGQVLHAADLADFMLRDPNVVSADAAVDRAAALAPARLAPHVADCLADRLHDGLYDSLADTDNLPWRFESVRRQVGDAHVDHAADAIGITLDVLSRVVDNKHPYTIGHSRRVARYSLLIGIVLGIEHDDLTLLKWAALIHDVGKLSVSPRMLDKPAALSLEEYEALQFHASYTFDIISTITDLRPVASIASSHHERYDGRGYPLGWAGEDIPLGARVIAVADAFDAMTSRRPYRPPCNADHACAELERKAGTQFDPGIVRGALPVLRNLARVVASV